MTGVRSKTQRESFLSTGWRVPMKAESVVKGMASQGVYPIVSTPKQFSERIARDYALFGQVAKAANVAVPRTVLLPHKQYPSNTEAKSFRNMRWVNWDEVFDYLKFPIFMKPAYGGGWRDVYKCDDPTQFFHAYDQSHSLTMMAQEAIDFTDYYRCYGLGREPGSRSLEVRVPAGVDTGTRIQLGGEGEVGPGGGPPGDLYVEVVERPHPLFTRRGDDLHAVVPVPMKPLPVTFQAGVGAGAGDAAVVQLAR